MSDIFEKYGNKKVGIVDDSIYPDVTLGIFTLEELYQAFKERYDREELDKWKARMTAMSLFEDMPSDFSKIVNDNLGELVTDTKYGCHRGLEVGAKPDDCVIDEGDYDGCIFAHIDMTKEQCGYYKPIK